MSDRSNPVSVLEPLPAARQAPPSGTLRAALFQAVPSCLVFGILGGLLLWGHYSGWAAPKFSALIGSARDAPDDWCDAHRVPESLCVECNDSLLPRLQDSWCRTHGVHNCPFEHPEVVQTKAAPMVEKADLDRAQRALALKERAENNSKCKAHHRRLQFASQEVMDKMGIDVTPVWRDAIVETVPVSGEITYEQPRVAPLFTPLAGRVWAVTPQGQLGATVKKGDVLALINAADVGKAKAEFLQAAAQFDLKGQTLTALQALAPEGAISAARLREMETAYREAHIHVVAAQHALVNLGLVIGVEEVKGLAPEQLGRRLQFLGLPAEITHRLDPDTTTANLIAVRASQDGVVTEARVVAGEMTDPGKTLFVVADTRRMWLKLHVRSEDVKYLHIRDDHTGAPGQTVRFRPDGSDQDVTGELIWKSTAIDEKTRTLQFRTDLPNPDGRLLAHTFGTGQVILRAEKDAIVVPSEAVHWEGDCHVVFIRDKHFLDEGAPKVFHVRTVRPGVNTGRNTEILAGVLPGEVVATRNSAALRAELLKNNLGTG